MSIQQYRSKTPEPEPLLVTRGQAAKLINRSTSSIIRYEKLGLLEPIKFAKGRSAHVLYRKSDILKLINGRP